MKNITFIVVIVFALSARAQVTVDDTMTSTQLIEDIFINSDCVSVSNVISSTGTNFGDVNGIAAFDENGSGFPWSGIVLSSGSALEVPGPNDVALSSGGTGWPGDVDLEAVTGVMNTNNASSIQFDFVPFTNSVHLEFIMASEEYNQEFECTFSDAFAFILTDLQTGVVTNLAVLPETNIPIEVTNIHPEVPGICDAVNEEYFGQYNFEPFNPASNAPINFNGQIISLTGSSIVEVGNPYSIKMVIADAIDTAFDMAVFLKEESFTYEIDLGEDYTVANDNPICGSPSITLGIDSFPGNTYQWFEFNSGSGQFEVIPGAINSFYEVSTNGEYMLESTNASCIISDSIQVEFIPITEAGEPQDIFINDGDNNSFAIFDLTINEPLIFGPNNPADFGISYHTSQAGAITNTAAIANPTSYMNVTNPQTIYVRFEELLSGCFDVTNFEIQADGPLGLNDTDRMEVIAFPNPGNGEFTIQSVHLISECLVEVYSITGELLYSEKLVPVNSAIEVDISNLPSGIYFTRLSVADKQNTIKTVIR